MAHLPPQSLPDFPAFPQPKTLILKSPDTTAILLEVVDGKRKSSPLKFDSALDAMKWCDANHASFWYQPPHDPARN